MSFTDSMIRKLRRRIREEAEILEAVSVRLEELHRTIPAPDLEELHAMEAGEATLSLEALWISVLAEQEFYISEASTDLFSAASMSRAPARSRRYRMRPYAKDIAMLRSGLLGRTLPEGFRPDFAEIDSTILLQGQSCISTVGVALVSDLLVKGYAWGG